jgi:hypothetical protein
MFNILHYKYHSVRCQRILSNLLSPLHEGLSYAINGCVHIIGQLCLSS